MTRTAVRIGAASGRRPLTITDQAPLSDEAGLTRCALLIRTAGWKGQPLADAFAEVTVSVGRAVGDVEAGDGTRVGGDASVYARPAPSVHARGHATVIVTNSGASAIRCATTARPCALVADGAGAQGSEEKRGEEKSQK